MKDLFDLDFSRWEIMLLSLIPALINIGIFLYVNFFLPQNRTNHTFSVFVLLVGFWQLGDGFIRMSLTVETASQWNRLSGVFMLFVISFGILFTLNFSKWWKGSSNRVTFILLFLPAIICSLFTVARLDTYTIIKSEHWYWIVNPEPTFITSVIYLWIASGLLFMLVLFWVNYVKAGGDETKRKQSFLLAVGFSVPIVGGITAEIIFPLILGIDDVPVGGSLFTIFSMISLLAIKKYNLLEYSPREQWDHIVESMNEGILIVDNDDRIMYANKMFCELVEYEFAEIKGKVSHKLLLDEKDKKQIETLEKKKTLHYEIQLKTKSGKKIWVQTNGSSYMDRRGKVIGSIRIKTDITERKIAEEERTKMTGDIISRNKDLEQFAYIVSHNLRSSVANIIGFSNAIEDPDLSEDMQTEFKQGLSASAKKLDTVIRDLNTILEIKREVMENRRKVYFSELMNDIQYSLAHMIEKERVIIITDFSEVDEMTTLKTYLHSIFYNLITKSIKYKRPFIDPVIEVCSQKYENRIELLFRDNGIGIDLEQNREQVFGLYKRFHTQVEGKGMGLFMTKTHVETLGGRISIKSKINQGTEIKIAFEI